MGQITIYLDEASETKLKLAAKSAGLSVSRWLAEIIQERTCTEWPEEVKSLAGAWPDFPDLEELRAASHQDIDREAL
jgi:hypothetical protein